ncbi:MAG: hypothetical protein Q4P32_01020 [Micrococcales bacterium]|nr:hypothetical protein [Micrococcales bacterium]
MVGGSFPGFGEGAPLDLSSLSDALAHSVLSRVLDGTHGDLADALAHVGNCVRPIRLHGCSQTIDRATGEVLASFSSSSAPLGVLMTGCGNRRASVCPACSRVYARDTFELIRAGVVGGKTVPADVADAPLLFVTLTAPSFGLVHGHRIGGKACRPRSSDRVDTCPHGRRMACNARHDEEDRFAGSPLCWDCYDWTSAVVWQWWAPELWCRTTIAIRRHLAHALGAHESTLRKHASVQFAKVAEFQARGLVHFHALIRLDGPDGPGSCAPLDGQAFANIVDTATHSVTHAAPATSETDRERILAWGAQLDIRTVNSGRHDLRSCDELTPAQVAGYLAKYATKDAGELRLDRRGDFRGRSHLVKLAEHSRELGALAMPRERLRDCLAHPERHEDDDLDGMTPTIVPVGKGGRDPYALLGKWAHMLGFRGHFSTKSRRYSVTLGRLRRARDRYRRAVVAAEREGQPLDVGDLERRLLADEDDQTTLVVGSWAYAGTG